MTRAIAQQARTIRLPNHVTEKLNNIKKTQRELALSLGRTATTTEVAAALGITPDAVREYIRKAREPISLNMTVGKEQNSELSELIEDQSASLETQLSQKFMREDIARMLASLKPNEREVLWLRFGLEDGEEWTLRAIAKKLNVSRERVRQLQNRALLRLKNRNIGALRDYLVG